MKTIYRDNADRLSVADAKRLILEALPPERSGEVYAQVDENGDIDFEGPVELKVVYGVQIYESFIDRDFLTTCEQLSIQPRMKYRPAVMDYTWKSSENDTLYTIGHDEFSRVTELFGLTVAIGPALEPQAAPEQNTKQPAPMEPAKAGPLPLTTGDIAFCFAGLHWGTEKKWKKPLGDKPKWLQSCIAIPGLRGVTETRWNPVSIGAALVSNGHAKTNSVRARFQTKPFLIPWLDAWKTYEADNFVIK